MYGNAVFQIARKEFIQHLRTKRLFITALLLLITMALVTIVGPSVGLAQQKAHGESSYDMPESIDGGAENYTAPPETYEEYQPNFVMLIYLNAPLLGGYMFLQLVAIILTSDSVCSEWRQRTIFLVLSKPVPRSAFLIGKYLGTVAVLALLILIAFSLDYLIMNLVLPEGHPGDTLAFFAAIPVLILGTAATAALALFISTITKSSTLAILMGLGLWLLILPTVASIGYLTTLGDEDFENYGELNYGKLYDECGYPPRYQFGFDERDTPEFEAAEAAYDACYKPYWDDYAAFYAKRGIIVFDEDVEREKCWSFDNNRTSYDPDCDQAVRDRDRAQGAIIREIQRSKYDSWRVDWSRYISPASTMTIADELIMGDRAGGDFDEISFSPLSMFAGADVTPAKPWLGAVALLAFSAAFVGFAILVITRRNFE